MKEYPLFNQPPAPPRRAKRESQTRNAAYLEHVKREGAGNGFTDSQQQVYDVIATRPSGISNTEIARILGWSINRVTPRTLELRGKGAVTAAGRRECTVTGSTAQTWKTAKPQSNGGHTPCQ